MGRKILGVLFTFLLLSSLHSNLAEEIIDDGSIPRFNGGQVSEDDFVSIEEKMQKISSNILILNGYGKSIELDQNNILAKFDPSITKIEVRNAPNTVIEGQVFDGVSISIVNCSDSIIANNTVKNIFSPEIKAISVESSPNTIVKNNYIFNLKPIIEDLGHSPSIRGIYVFNSTNVSISSNNISDNNLSVDHEVFTALSYCIDITVSSNSTILSNSIRDMSANHFSAIRVQSSNYVLIDKNIISNITIQAEFSSFIRILNSNYTIIQFNQLGSIKIVEVLDQAGWGRGLGLTCSVSIACMVNDNNIYDVLVSGRLSFTGIAIGMGNNENVQISRNVFSNISAFRFTAIYVSDGGRNFDEDELILNLKVSENSINDIKIYNPVLRDYESECWGNFYGIQNSFWDMVDHEVRNLYISHNTISNVVAICQRNGYDIELNGLYIHAGRHSAVNILENSIKHLQGDGTSIGIFVHNTNHSIIQRNVIENITLLGISIVNAEYPIIQENILDYIVNSDSDFDEYGIYLDRVNNSLIIKNNISSVKYWMGTEDSQNTECRENRINGKLVNTCYESRDTVIPFLPSFADPINKPTPLTLIMVAIMGGYWVYRVYSRRIRYPNRSPNKRLSIDKLSSKEGTLEYLDVLEDEE
ncbi:MAG: right-handed parallel beta-helix repeat-containing protein [Candidatus Kariarchaeaceae archaeon]|jgi:parallel beta-helix repeat protein